MLSIYDLYDLHAILVRIRFAPEADDNYDIILNVVDVLTNEKKNNGANQFRIAIQSIKNIKGNSLYDFVHIENRYSYYPLPPLKDENIYKVLISSCMELLRVISEKNKERIFELTDCLHNLPIMIVENKYTIPKSFWKKEIKYYRQKWNKSFLTMEQGLN